MSLKSKSLWMLCAGVAAGLLIGVGMMMGALAGAGYSSRVAAQPSPLQLPAQFLHANAAAVGKNMAIATGPVFEEAEGLFILDFLTGDLQCWIPNANQLYQGGYMGIYKANVLEAFGADAPKNPDYMLVTGGVNASRGATGNSRPAQCVCYVIEGTSGKVAAYSLAIDRTAFRTGAAQTGNLILLNPAVSARPDVQRDQ